MRLVIAFLALSLTSAASASPLVTAVVSTRAAKIIARHRLRSTPAPQPAPPKGQCCQECKTSGRPGYWQPDQNIWAECPCDAACQCKASGKAAPPPPASPSASLPAGAVIVRERVVSSTKCENGTCPKK